MILDDIIKQVNSFLRNYNDDIVDRFYYVYTVIGLSIYLLFITSKQYYGTWYSAISIKISTQRAWNICSRCAPNKYLKIFSYFENSINLLKKEKKLILYFKT